MRLGTLAASLALALALAASACLDRQERGGADDASDSDGGQDAGGGDAAADGSIEFDECVEGDWPGKEAECDPAPTLEVAFATPTDGGPALHWPMSLGCIRVTYQPALEPNLGEVTAALDAWDDLTCSRLCFGTPSPAQQPPPTMCHAHVLHFTTDHAGFNEQIVVGSSLTFDEYSGVLFSAVVSMRDVSVGAKNLAGAVGRALGLASPTEADSVLNHTHDATAPTVADEESMCAIYGRPKYCDD